MEDVYRLAQVLLDHHGDDPAVFGRARIVDEIGAPPSEGSVAACYTNIRSI